PSELRGNIRCISHPDDRVFGYISAGTRSVEKIFVTAQDIGIYRYYQCQPLDMSVFAEYQEPPTNLEIYHMGYRPVGDIGDFEWLIQECVECTTRGTKNKPSFWPNDHI
ncbi:MAG: DUF4249 domain-containing protein, partial [Bacteroidales bacterium]|nr:DUF4249 domain-containing protein [Bacteroidales bacterium]